MRAIFAVAALAALLGAAPARAAEFEGLVEGRITGPMPGSFRAQVGKAGIRTEMEVNTAEAARASGAPLPPGTPALLKRVTLQRRAEPRKIYLIDDERKSYAVVDAAESAKDAPGEAYTVQKLGKDVVAGFGCEKVRATGAKSGEVELCVTSELAPEWAQSAMQQGRGGGGLIAALRQAGVKGYPVRWSRKDAKGAAMAMELTSARRQPVPASALAVPKGYTQQKGPGGGAGAARSDADALRKLTPEQRRGLEQQVRRKPQPTAP